MMGGKVLRIAGAPTRALIVAGVLMVAGGCGANRSAGGREATTTRSQPERVEQSVTLQTPGGVVHGTLLSQVVSSLRPVALIIAGSGPTDRNGNSPLLPGPNNSLKLLAEALADEGIATLRYDKRGIAASAGAAGREEDLRFDDYVTDAAAWVRMLRDDPRFSTVTVIGHSEGAAIGALAAGKGEADAYVSISGIARRAPAVLRDQLRPQLPAPLWAESERILAELEAGRTTANVPPELAALYRPSVQPYLISWFAVDPVAAVAALDVPVLIAQGTTDIQTSVAEADSLRRGRLDARIAIIEGMNHVLKLVPLDPTQQAASYSNPALPVAPALVDSISTFIHDVSR